MLQMIFTLLLLCAAGALGASVQRPKNLAVSVGGSSYFNCSTNTTGSINWAFSPDGDLASSSVIQMTDSCNITASFSGNFRTEKPNSNVCNLIVFNANLQLGGYYACVVGSGVIGNTVEQGILVVADTRSSIVTNVTEFKSDCEEAAFFEMAVDYSGPSPIAPSTLPPLYPSLKWTLKSDPSNTISSSETVTNTTSSSHIIVNPMISPVPSYVSTLFFKPPTNPPQYCDSSAPNFTFSWETQEINTSCIELDASSITVTSYIESLESGSCEAKILECQYNAYPPPHDVHWLDVIRNEVVNGTRITAEYGGEYVFSVTIAVNGHDHSANVTYRLNNDSAFAMDKCKGVTEVNVTMSLNKGLKIFYAAETLNTNILRNNYNSQKAAEVTTGNATEAMMTCLADGLPNPSYAWYSSDCQNPISTYQQLTVNASSSYTCAANNSINDRKFSKNNTIKITFPGADSVICSNDLGTPPPPPNDDWIWLLLILLILVFLLPACVFLPYYGLSKSCRENVNDEFPWIEKALPCMNGKGCECSGGMVLFIFCLVICGIVFVPWILIASHCCQKNSKKSQGDINLQERNGSTEGHRQSGVSRSSSTGAPNQAPPPRPPSVDHSHSYQGQTNYHPSSNRSMHSPSPVSSSGVEYGELKIDAKPGSRRPVELIIQKESAYAELQKS